MALLHLLLTPTSGPTGAEAPPPAGGVDLETALRARLRAEPTLAALSDVYWDHPISRPVYPYLTVNQVEEAPTHNTSDSYIDAMSLQFTVSAYGSAQAKTLGLAAWEALRPIDANPPLEFAGGHEVVRLPGVRRGPDELPGAGPAGLDVWRYSFDYRFLLGKGG